MIIATSIAIEPGINKRDGKTQYIWIINPNSHQELVNKYEVDLKSGYYTYAWRSVFYMKK